MGGERQRVDHQLSRFTNKGGTTDAALGGNSIETVNECARHRDDYPFGPSSGR
jgi:hypothetical protein